MMERQKNAEQIMREDRNCDPAVISTGHMWIKNNKQIKYVDNYGNTRQKVKTAGCFRFREEKNAKSSGYGLFYG